MGIRHKLDTNSFETLEEFVADMRLVFKNAMTYNSSRDNIVHIAARELSGKFEEKYRQYSASWNNQVPDAPTHHTHGTRGPTAAAKTQATLQKAPAPVSRLSKQARQPIKTPVPRQSSVPLQRQRSSTGGSGRGPPATRPPPMDVTAQAQMQMMRDMERRMAEMQAELNTLRQQQQNQPPYQAVPQQQYAPPVQAAKPSARQPPQRRASAPIVSPAVVQPPVYVEPLTFEEKKNLISQIHTLKPEKMEKVVEIIQAAMPPDRPDNGEEVEIPIDELDTATLRRLQEFVEGKKRPPASITAPPTKKGKLSPNGPPKGAYIPSKSQSSTALDSMQTQKSNASAAQSNDGFSSSVETAKRPRSDSIEFDELVSGSTKLMNDGSGLGLIGDDALKADSWISNESSSRKLEPVHDSVSWGSAVTEKEDKNIREKELKAEEEKASKRERKLRLIDWLPYNEKHRKRMRRKPDRGKTLKNTLSDKEKKTKDADKVNKLLIWTPLMKR